MARILLVEDDPTISMGVEYSLRQEGFETLCAGNLAEARKLREKAPDLILLDLTLPDGNGYELCREFRGKGDTPVIFLTACDEEANIVLGLDMGADDYITKPFRLRELISRIRAVLRRRQPGGEEALLEYAGLRMDTRAVKVYKNGAELTLTALEYRLLLTLMLNRGQVLSRSRLLESIWDAAGDFVNDNTLTVYIRRLREKLEDDPQAPSIIKTVRGIGYKIGD